MFYIYHDSPVVFKEEGENKTLRIVITDFEANHLPSPPIKQMKSLNDKPDSKLIKTITPQKPEEEEKKNKNKVFTRLRVNKGGQLRKRQQSQQIVSQ